MRTVCALRDWAAAGIFLAAALGAAWQASTPPVAGAAQAPMSEAAARFTAPAGPAVEQPAPRGPSTEPASVRQQIGAAPPIPPWADPLALRLRVAAAGPVALSGTELATAGWELAAVDAAEVALSRDGSAVPLVMLRGQRRIEEGSLRPDDRLIFSAAPPDSPFSPHALYWLQPRGQAERFEAGGGSETDRSMAGGPAEPGYSQATPFGPSSVIGRRILGRDDYFLAHFQPPGGDRWLWDESLGGDRERSFELPHAPHPAPAGRTHLTLGLLGGTDDPDVPLDHRVGLYLDGRRVAAAGFGGRTVFTLAATISNTLWAAREGVDGELDRPALVLRNESDPNSLSSVFVDHVHLQWDALAAGGSAAVASAAAGMEGPGPSNEADGDADLPDGAALRFATRPEPSATEPGLLRILSMTAGRHHVLAQPPLAAQPIWWTVEPRTADDGPNTLSIAGVPPASRVEVWREGTEQAVIAIERNEPSSFGSASSPAPTGADWVAFADSSLLPALEPLAAWRSQQGLRARLVDIQDVWDEGAFGLPDPAALAALLAQARKSWRPAPRYVLLVGEANLDHRGADAARRGRPGPPDLLPTWTLDRADGRVQSSDLPYVSGGREGAPADGVALGRLPGSSEEEVAAVVTKILRWEGASIGADASPAPLPPRRALFVDDGSSATIGATASALAARLASRMSLARLAGARWRATGEDLPAAVGEELGQGAWLVAYLGHGNADTWAHWPGFGYLLHVRDLEEQVAEGAIPPIENDAHGARAAKGLLLAVSCLNGAFDHPVKAGSLAERWLIAPGGGVAAWAPSGRARLPAQAALVDALLVAVASGPAPGAALGAARGDSPAAPSGLARPIGDLVADARRVALAGRPERREASLGMVLFGDPAMPLEPGAGARIVARVDGAIYLPWAAR